MAAVGKSLSEKIAIGQARFVRSAPRLVRRMTVFAVGYFKVTVFRDQGKDVNPNGWWKARKRWKKKRRPVLIGEVRGGKMRRSIIGNWHGLVGIVSSNVPYMAYHQKGTPNMPQRKVLGDSKVLSRKFDQMILKQLQKSLEK